ncbi:hypothetical protein UT300018_34200 [Clostridium faecium]
MSTTASEADDVVRSLYCFEKVNGSEQYEEVKERRAEFTYVNEHWSD